MWSMHADRGWGMGWCWSIMIGIVFLAFVALVIWVVVRLIERGGHNVVTNNRTPLDIAEERYAKGEITKDQFEQIKKDLIQ